MNISNNQLVGFKLPEGWRGPDSDGGFRSPDGDYQKQPPAGAELILDGIIAISDAAIKFRMAAETLARDGWIRSR